MVDSDSRVIIEIDAANTGDWLGTQAASIDRE
jgi:hypothetical protein